MNNRIQGPDFRDEEFPAWLPPLLRECHRVDEIPDVKAVPVTDELRQLCREASLRALDIQKLREERKNLGQLIVSLHDYLKTLAKRANVNLRPLLAAFEIRRPDRPDRNSAHGLARLARYIGLKQDDAWLLMRLNYARYGGQGVSAMADGFAKQHLNGPPCDSRSECKAALDQLEAKYNREMREGLHAMAATFRAVYAEKD